MTNHRSPAPIHLFLMAGAMGMALVSTARAERVTLPTGETLEVEILEATEKGFKAKHVVLGEIEIPRDGVTIVNAENQPIEPPPPPPPPSPWTFAFALGGGANAGNTETANVNAIFTANYQAGNTRFAYDAGYFYGSDGDTTTENRLTTGAIVEFDIEPTNWFWGASTRFDYDEFQSWRYRVTGHGFIGYHILREDPFTLDGRLGLGFLKEFESVNDDWQLEGLVGLGGTWKLAENSTIVWNTTYYPSITNSPEYRWDANIGWTTAIDMKNRINFLILFSWEYQSQIAEDRKHNDFRLSFNIQTQW